MADEMDTPRGTPFTVPREILSSLQPQPFHGKDMADTRRFISVAHVYFTALGTVEDRFKYMVLLGLLREDAAKWAGPHLSDLASNEEVWKTFSDFSKDFLAHFCAIDDEEAAMAELVKLGKTYRKLGAVKDYTAEFDVIASRTELSDVDKQEQYCGGLPARIKDVLATSSHDVSDYSKLKSVALTLDQRMAAREEEKPKPFKSWGKGQKVAATSEGSGQRGFCFVCGGSGHKPWKCPQRKTKPAGIASTSTTTAPPAPKPTVAATSSSTSNDALLALTAQLKELQLQIDAVTAAKAQEDF